MRIEIRNWNGLEFNPQHVKTDPKISCSDERESINSLFANTNHCVSDFDNDNTSKQLSNLSAIALTLLRVRVKFRSSQQNQNPGYLTSVLDTKSRGP